ncbi:MAG: signal peptide peptidase SppA [Bacteroidales bacterium]|nr:signal peptide peptidase SppA [Bacteroidales bacterium]
MKSFLKSTLAAACGVLLVFVVVIMFFGAIFGAIAAAGESTPTIPSEGVLKIDMSAINITEQQQESDPMEILAGGSTTETIGLWNAINAINTASSDPAVKYIYLLTDGSVASSTTLEELRASLSKFKSSGKPIIAYTESPSTGSYYLASVADKIYMTSYQGASAMVTGVSSQMIFLGDLFKRLGINMQLVRYGKYKSAGEMYTRSSSSAENREQYQRLVDSMWESMSGEIAESRGMTVETLDKYIDNIELNLPEDFLRCGMVDSLYTREQLQNQLAVLAVKEDYKDVKMIPFADYAAAKAPASKASKSIAIIYADGEIIDGSDTKQIAGDRFAKLIEKARRDSTVKAVVLRVNSPGGSVLASEKIKHELDLLGEVKPIVASYGSYAASGGYWISNNCDKIFTNKTTLTGSIGVFGLIPDVSGTLKNIAHVNIESVNSHKHSDMLNGMRPFDDAEHNYMYRSIDNIYKLFLATVSEGRGISEAEVDAVGQGRVWTGSDALGIDLVDEIGTLEDALHYTASIAGDPDLNNWDITSYPKPQTSLEALMSLLGQSTEEEVSIVKAFKEISEPTVVARIDRNIEIKL